MREVTRYDIYGDGCDITNDEGHVASCESKEIAQEIVRVLNAALQPTWTGERPTVLGGHYWWRQSDTSLRRHWRINRVDETDETLIHCEDGGVYRVDKIGGQWSSQPIGEPRGE